MRDLYIRWMELPEPLPRESCLNRLPVVKHLAEGKIEFHKQVTFFVGENGSGKSTLIEAWREKAKGREAQAAYSFWLNSETRRKNIESTWE